MRLDRALVERGLAVSRSQAQALVSSGAVTLNGQVAKRPAQPVDEHTEIALSEEACPWASRAGLKLDHALTQFGLSPSGVALDLGASTGGFTDVLLARGASHVHAVDVGHGQLVRRLAEDPRVTLHEGVNARALPEGLIPPPDWITADLSFISLRLALPPSLGLAKAGTWIVALIKPQFEAGREAVGRGGLVRDPAIHRAVCSAVWQFLSDSGWDPEQLIDSPILGGSGNREFLIAARKR